MGKAEKKARKQEIQFRKSLFRFFTAFFIVTILGFVTNGVLATFPLEEKILSNLEIPEQYQLEIHKPQLRFRRGLLPVLGIVVERVEITDKECAAKQLFGQNLLLTVSPWSLLKGTPRINHVRFDFLKLDLPQSCTLAFSDNKKENSKNSKKTKITSTATAKVDKKGFQNPLSSSQLEEFFQDIDPFLGQVSFSSIHIQDFELKYWQKLKEETLLRGKLIVKFKEKSRVTLEAEFKKIHIQGKDIPINSSVVTASLNNEKIEVESKSFIREGAIGLHFKLINDQEFPAEVEIQLNKLPLSLVTSVISGTGQVSYLWASCHGLVQSSWETIFSQPVKVSNCMVDGPYGNVAIQKLDVTLRKVNEFQAEVNKLNLDEVLKDKRQVYLSGVFARYGTLSQKLHYKGGVFSVEGLVENSELIFSNNNLRDIQKIKTLPFSFKGNTNHWQAEIEKVVLDNGELDGQLQIQLRPSQQQAEGKITIHKLLLNPRIYKLMLKAQPSLLKVYGKFFLEDGKMKDWSAFLVTPELESEQYRFSKLKVKAQSQGEDLSEIAISSQSGQVKSDSELVRWLSATLLDSDWSSEEIEFKELSVKMNLYRDKNIEWKRGYARLKNNWQISSEGRRSASRNIEAWLQWDRPDDRIMKWDFQGEFFQGTWRPLTPWVQEWLRQNQEYLKDNKDISFQVSNDQPQQKKSKKVSEASAKKKPQSTIPTSIQWQEGA